MNGSSSFFAAKAVVWRSESTVSGGLATFATDAGRSGDLPRRLVHPDLRFLGSLDQGGRVAQGAAGPRGYKAQRDQVGPGINVFPSGYPDMHRRPFWRRLSNFVIGGTAWPTLCRGRCGGAVSQTK